MSNTRQRLGDAKLNNHKGVNDYYSMSTWKFFLSLVVYHPSTQKTEIFTRIGCNLIENCWENITASL